MLFYERLEAVFEHRRLQRVLAGVAAAAVGLILVRLVQFAAATVAATPSLVVSLTICGLALAMLYR